MITPTWGRVSCQTLSHAMQQARVIPIVGAITGSLFPTVQPDTTTQQLFMTYSK
ncbi:hypothetical protein [Xanthocytophaga agilis]|uniref:Uncharacterized protein n=1 Tax=Xanthocytophaga agilis TaxID=3048010 RepID=A0AAE3RAW9_9BACT|nr:hypothetical protein [Xanthocytophaga agilis]MDJ1504745.1 hypothetical protein [Xanthocytophaga agilis]